MSDIFPRAKRSVIMSKISGKETKPEVMVRKYLFAKGFRYRKNVKDLPGKPDIVLSKYKTVIFVNGCFWHGHENCKYFRLPKTRTEWWKEKINRNKQRDTEQKATLENLGWKVMTVWECEIKKDKGQCLNNILETIAKL